MSALALKDEVANMVSTMSEAQLKYVLQFVRFINQQPDIEEEKLIRNKKDLELINAHAVYLNSEAEENLEFQADIWGDE